jgi:ataxin-10
MFGAKRGIDGFYIGLLQRFERFLPRVMFGRPVDLSTLPLPPGVDRQLHPVPNTAVPPEDPAAEGDGSLNAGFNYVKRDLVRLLGVLCTGEKGVQDRARACGGIPVVMNLCVVDERNPCKCPEPYSCLDLPPSRWGPHCCASHPFICPHGSSRPATDTQ